ncbi:ABC transporter ATP-binding protein [Nocardioides sp.]|uniref:ATP-binding cassette domain-containing protein n=1 Tax=Nocardioides sp. TaxID=35761 RepID=UPI0026017CAC|nr:ABC transporter ATP-binding protein [Nocardioides sp.]
MRSPGAGVAVLITMIAAVGQALATVVAGHLAQAPRTGLVVLLGTLTIGPAIAAISGRVVWYGCVDRAEGRLRADLLTAALHQPLADLSEQAAGEILDRVDDDTHEVGSLLRGQAWEALVTVCGLVPMWLVAGFTWWPAFVLLPAMAGLIIVAIRPLLGVIAERKVREEMAWTDNAAALEEGVAARNDLRTSLGQAHMLGRFAAICAQVHARFLDVVRMESRLVRVSGLLLHGLLAAVGIAGVWLAADGQLTVARLVTLFLITTSFVGQVDQLGRHLPDLQAGIGALTRLRQLLDVEPEPVGGAEVPGGALDLELRDLSFSYDEGTFSLTDVSLRVPAGQTLALVGRTGSGKSTLAAMLSRAVEPPPGTILLGGVDVTTVDLQRLRSAVGVVTQRTEILAGTLTENITLFEDAISDRVPAAVAELGLAAWVAGLPDGLDTVLGPGGTALSAGEEQLVAFARLLVRDVQVVVLDEATARMDPLTEARVVAASERLLSGRTGILVAHRLSTIERADLVAVLDRGRVVQQGPRTVLAAQPGPFADLLAAGATATSAEPQVSSVVEIEGVQVGTRRRQGEPPEVEEPGTGPGLARGIAHALVVRPWWGLFSVLTFLGAGLLGSQGAITGLLWGRIVEQLQEGATPRALLAVLTVTLLCAPLLLSDAVLRYPRWWVEVMLRARMSVLAGQIRPHRLPATPPGEVVARAMDADRFARYADRWVDFTLGLAIATVTAIAAGTWVAGAVLLIVMTVSALASSIGRPIAGRSATRSSAARARFGRVLVSVLDSARTVKLAGRITQVRRHLAAVDEPRVNAAVFEHRVQAVLDGVPIVMVQCGVVAAWALLLEGVWGLATALLVANAVNGFNWFGRVAGAVVTEAPGTRSWMKATSAFAGGADLMDVPPGVDLVTGAAPAAADPAPVPLRALELAGVTAVYDDGTIGVRDVSLKVERGELVLLLGQVGSGKSSLLSALAGLVAHSGQIRWNGEAVSDPQVFLRPGQVAHVAQVPRVLSGTFSDNVRLGFDRELGAPVRAARLDRDMSEAGGHSALVGHRGVRLSGGQVQRLALARALATGAELLLADDVSSALDATTEIELWAALRARGATVVGATSKRSALAEADRVVVLVDGEVAAEGPWSMLAGEWGHLAG